MWVIQTYEKGSDELVSEQDIGDLDVTSLRPLWNVPETDPMLDTYPLTEEIARDLELDTATKFDFDRFDYFLEKKGSPAK